MSNSPDLALGLLKMLLSLAVVLVIIWGLYRVARKSLPMAQGGGKSKSMQVLESQYLGLKKTITMVQVPGSILVLGVSPDKVNLLTRIDDPTIIKGILESAGSHRSVLSFKDHLQRLTGTKGGGSLAVNKQTIGE